jgi:hypothetical protein
LASMSGRGVRKSDHDRDNANHRATLEKQT